MKVFVLVAAFLVASVHSRDSCVNWVDTGAGSISGSGSGSVSGKAVNPTTGQSSGGDNIFAQLFRKAGHVLAATETAKSNILNNLIQAPASIAQGLVAGAGTGISSIAQDTGNAAANFANNAESAVRNTWRSF
ncbi:hypothetical protein WA026_014402 [Henosepilachna vigintioctopunctata]|uniref:Uncharacterized protein n=1 Tax=Henosepilachna vigintioctopunctata TaxID=420089 RepID=A0AAW1ULZ5_9CUCU